MDSVRITNSITFLRKYVRVCDYFFSVKIPGRLLYMTLSVHLHTQIYLKQGRCGVKGVATKP